MWTEPFLDIMEKNEEEFQKTEDARKRMEEDLGEGDDHLDVTLEDEGAYLEQYKKLMKIIWYTPIHNCILLINGANFVTFGGNNFLGQTVSFGICQGVVSSRDKIHCLDPSKQPWTLANLWNARFTRFTNSKC